MEFSGLRFKAQDGLESQVQGFIPTPGLGFRV